MPSATDVKINAVLDRLRGALGTGENPPGSDNNHIVKWYNENVDRIGRGAWCEMTVTWAMWTGGAKALKVGRAYTVWATQDFIGHKLGGSWHYGTSGMRPGDQVYYDWTGRKNDYRLVDHTGLVEKINGNGTFYALEGNTGEPGQLKRVLRDGKYVVGYGRFNWGALTPPPAPQKPSVPRPKPNRDLTKQIQKLVEVPADGFWGKKTDRHAILMRTAAAATVGSPKNTPAKFDVGVVQRILDINAQIEPYGTWGPVSQRAMTQWVKDFQKTVGVDPVGGHWGPKTDHAFLVVRKQNVNNF